MNINWNAKTVKLSELKPYGRNPRRISEAAFKKLKESIQQDGYHQRIVANTDLTVVGGHQRLKALKELGIKEVEILVPEQQIDHEDFRRILVRDNLPFGEFDMDMLANDFDQDELMDWGMPEDWLPTVEEGENTPNGDEDEAEEPPEAPRTVLGDIYEIGNHRLLCGDSLSYKDVENLTQGTVCDMLFTDPPYGMNYSGRGKKTSNKILNDNIQPTDMYNVASEIKERYIWGRAENYKHLTEQPRDVIIWVKNNFGMGRGYRGQYECCFYYGDFSGSDSDVWQQSKDSNYEHPTQKPIGLCERAIKNSNPKSILDLYGGSGSTMVAAHKHNRICYMMELDPKYCDVIVSRMVKLYPDLDIKRNGEKIEWEGTDNG